MQKTLSSTLQMAIFDNIRILFLYADITSDLCRAKQ